jgi:endonuclease/exonuclease/phosphatase family metal-dependent hydrolase
MRYLRGLASIDGRSTYYHDAWEIGGLDGAGFTWDNRNDFASHSCEPDRRIDYVLVRSLDSIGRGRVIGARLVFDEAVDGTFASDHFGVLADIRV